MKAWLIPVFLVTILGVLVFVFLTTWFWMDGPLSGSKCSTSTAGLPITTQYLTTTQVPTTTTAGFKCVPFDGQRFSPINSTKCEKMTVPLCVDVGYKYSKMPNYFGDTDQTESGLEAHQFYPLVKVQCSPDLQLLLCSLYAPVCNSLGRLIPPCRSVCQSSRSGCEPLMNKFGFIWPENISCEDFPDDNGDEICIKRLVNDEICNH